MNLYLSLPGACMPFTPSQMDELTILTQFNLDSMQSGIKVHAHEASPAMVAAAARLHSKGLVTQPDGGYLTGLGLDAARHAQALALILK